MTSAPMAASGVERTGLATRLRSVLRAVLAVHPPQHAVRTQLQRRVRTDGDARRIPLPVPAGRRSDPSAPPSSAGERTIPVSFSKQHTPIDQPHLGARYTAPIARLIPLSATWR